MLVQPTEDEGAHSERPSEAQPTPSPTQTSEVTLVPQTDPSPTHTSEVPVEPQTDPSPRPSPSTIIPDSIPESSCGNLGGHSSSDKSLSGNEGEMTLQSVYDLWKKFAKGEPSVHKDPLFDETPEGTLDYMETEDAQDVGRTRDVVDEEKENAEDVLSIDDVLSTAQQKVSTDKEKVSTNRPIVSTDGSKVSTDKQKDSIDDQNEGTDDHTEGGWATQTTQTPTSIIFGDDETIAQVLLSMSQAKAPLPKIDPKDKGKKKIEEEDESESESDGIPEAEKKFKQLASDEEMARKARIEADKLLAEKFQEEEREQFTIEERAKFLHDT
ncbi:hypothetical protein Tco_1518662, partial [Tanacetum coccineum]